MLKLLSKISGVSRLFRTLALLAMIIVVAKLNFLIVPVTADDSLKQDKIVSEKNLTEALKYAKEIKDSDFSHTSGANSLEAKSLKELEIEAGLITGKSSFFVQEYAKKVIALRDKAIHVNLMMHRVPGDIVNAAIYAGIISGKTPEIAFRYVSSANNVDHAFIGRRAAAVKAGIIANVSYDQVLDFGHEISLEKTLPLDVRIAVTEAGIITHKTSAEALKYAKQMMELFPNHKELNLANLIKAGMIANRTPQEALDYVNNVYYYTRPKYTNIATEPSFGLDQAAFENTAIEAGILSRRTPQEVVTYVTQAYRLSKNTGTGHLFDTKFLSATILGSLLKEGRPAALAQLAGSITNLDDLSAFKMTHETDKNRKSSFTR